MRSTLVGMDSPARLRIVFAEIHGSSAEVSSALDMIGKALGVEPGPALPPPPPAPVAIEAPAAEPRKIAPRAAKLGRPPAKPAPATPAQPKPPKIQSPLTALIVRELKQGPKRLDFLQSCAEDECPMQAEHLGKAVASLRRNGWVEDIEGGFLKLVKV